MASLDSDSADFFVRNHHDRSSSVLKILYISLTAWGCRSVYAALQRGQEVPLGPIRMRTQRETAENNLAATFKKHTSTELFSVEWSENRLLEIEVEVPSGRAQNKTRLPTFAAQVE